MRSTCFVAMAIAAVLSACGDDATASDAGLDATVDAGTDAGPRDAGPMCEPVCAINEACCAVDEGGAACTSIVRNIENCGACGLDCVETGRGDSCQASQCACGDFLLGCIGTLQSTCCVSPPGGRPPHCANLARDALDCGVCGNECDPMRTNACQGARCVCGDTRGPCEGADRCCADHTGTFACVDGATDPRHCGECGNRCAAGMRCEAGSCV